MNERINQLIKFLEEDPKDEFVRYALALEYLKYDSQKAKEEFDRLLQNHPAYLPTYYAAAHLMIELEQHERAEQLFVQGIELAKTQNNRKAQMELQSAYMVWQGGRD
jgi:Tfp pilus assembly protein PilF